jgi:glycosyltransferase involved in cell wall biosynthesis
VTARLTAILCNYNHGATVGRAIEAMLAQSRPPDELIVVEDGSTDHSHDVIQSWADRDHRILYLRNERNLGLFASFAKAVAAATGDYLYSGAADDYVLPGFFAAVMECGERFPQAPVISGKVVTALPDGRRTRVDGYTRFSAPVYLPPAEYLKQCLLPEPPTMSLSSATVYRRDALLSVGGWRPELGSWADTFSIRALGLKHGFCYVPHESVVWVIQPDGLSQSTMRNRDRAVQQVRLAAELMRSPEFSPVFPESYVRQWEQQMR